MLLSPSQVGMHIIKAVIFSQVNQHSCSTATVSGSTEAAVADPSAWRALPLLIMREQSSQVRHTLKQMSIWSIYLGTHGIQQSVSDLLSVAVTETRAAELTPHPDALRVTAIGFSVGCFLAALVTSGSLEIRRNKCVSSAKELDKQTQSKSFQHYSECGTYSGAVVDLLPHVVADSVQLHLCDLVHGTHHVRDGLGTVEGTPTGLLMK